MLRDCSIGVRCPIMIKIELQTVFFKPQFGEQCKSILLTDCHATRTVALVDLGS